MMNLPVFRSKLRTASIWKNVIHLTMVDSTNSEALRRLASEPDLHGTVIIAEEQTAGRGRCERHWISLPSNLACTVILRTSAPLSALRETSLVVGLALYKTVTAFATGQELRLKWPNDLLVNGKKCAGILVETIERNVIIGIGVNIVQAPDDLELRHPAGCLFAEASHVSREEFLAEFLNTLEGDWSVFEKAGFAPFRQAYLEAARLKQLEEEIPL